MDITAGSGGDSCSYSPEDLVRRDQMASFLTNTYDAAVAVGRNGRPRRPRRPDR